MNNKTTIPQAKLTPICLSLRNNAACCIRLRPLRDLRENNTQAYTINVAQTKPQCLSQIIADTPQTFNNLTSPSLTVFVCAIMQLAAFLCVISAISGRINTQEYSINPHRRNPNVSCRSRRQSQTPPIPANEILSLMMQLAALPSDKS